MIPGGITSHRGIRVEDLAGTFYLNDTLTKEHVGAPVALDPSANFTVGLAGDDAEILGVLQSFEDRVLEGVKTGSVNPLISFKFPYTGTAPVPGNRVVGAGEGAVKVAGAGAGFNTSVVAVDTDAGTCEVLIR